MAGARSGGHGMGAVRRTANAHSAAAAHAQSAGARLSAGGTPVRYAANYDGGQTRGYDMDAAGSSMATPLLGTPGQGSSGAPGMAAPAETSFPEAEASLFNPSEEHAALRSLVSQFTAAEVAPQALQRRVDCAASEWSAWSVWSLPLAGPVAAGLPLALESTLKWSHSAAIWLGRSAPFFSSSEMSLSALRYSVDHARYSLGCRSF